MLSEYSTAIRTVYSVPIESTKDFIEHIKQYKSVYDAIHQSPWIYESNSLSELLYNFTKTYYAYQKDDELEQLRCELKDVIVQRTHNLEKYILKQLISNKDCVIDSKDWSSINEESLTSKIEDICERNSLVMHHRREGYTITIQLN